jgi:hypothetical protein
VCIESYSDAQCGAEGDACFPCAADQTCIGHGCCGNLGRSCSAEEFCCSGFGCEDDKCCVNNDQPCTESSDCCNLGSEQICDNGKCVIPTGGSCQPGWMCQDDLPCPGGGMCGDPEGCTQEQDQACEASYPNGGCTTACGAPCCVGHRECASSCDAAQTCLEAACTPI